MKTAELDSSKSCICKSLPSPLIPKVGRVVKWWSQLLQRWPISLLALKSQRPQSLLRLRKYVVAQSNGGGFWDRMRPCFRNRTDGWDGENLKSANIPRILGVSSWCAWQTKSMMWWEGPAESKSTVVEAWQRSLETLRWRRLEAWSSGQSPLVKITGSEHGDWGSRRDKNLAKCHNCFKVQVLNGADTWTTTMTRCFSSQYIQVWLQHNRGNNGDIRDHERASSSRMPTG